MPAKNGRPVGRAHDRHRPAALAGHRLGGLHVDVVDVGSLLAVDLHVDEHPVHHRGHVRVLERLVGHHVAPVAGRVADRTRGSARPAREPRRTRRRPTAASRPGCRRAGGGRGWSPRRGGCERAPGQPIGGPGPATRGARRAWRRRRRRGGRRTRPAAQHGEEREPGSADGRALAVGPVEVGRLVAQGTVVLALGEAGPPSAARRTRGRSEGRRGRARGRGRAAAEVDTVHERGR